MSSLFPTLILLSLISILVLPPPIHSRPRKPSWNYLIKKTTTTTEPVPELDHLVIPYSSMSWNNNAQISEKISKHKPSKNEHHESQDQENFLSFIKYGFKTSTRAVTNYYQAISKMLTGTVAKERFDDSFFGSSNPGKKTHTKFGTKQEYDETGDKIKAVVLRGNYKDEDSYEKQESGGWGIGDMFWGAFYGPAKS